MKKYLQRRLARKLNMRIKKRVLSIKEVDIMWNIIVNEEKFLQIY